LIYVVSKENFAEERANLEFTFERGLAFESGSQVITDAVIRLRHEATGHYLTSGDSRTPT
jgi:hypothetical protein